MSRQLLYEHVVERLEKKIESGQLKPGDRLPSEAELAEAFDVSRATLREALNALAQDGTIEKRHGIGTFVAHTAVKVTGGLSTLESYTDTIRRSGHEAEEMLLAIRPALPGELDDINPFGDPEVLDSPAICVESLRTVNGEVAIFCADYLNPVLLHTDAVARVEIERPTHESLLDYLRRGLGVQPDHASLTVTAVAADPDVASRLLVPAGTPLLCLSGTAVDHEGRPLYFSRNYFLTDKYQFQIVRRSTKRSTKKRNR